MMLLDGHGNLLGLGLTGAGPVSSAAPVSGLAPGLANRDLGPATGGGRSAATGSPQARSTVPSAACCSW